jgi:hypothetical protein
MGFCANDAASAVRQATLQQTGSHLGGCHGLQGETSELLALIGHRALTTRCRLSGA